MSATGLAIGVDVGGTKTAAGVVDERGNVVEVLQQPTPGADAEATEAVIIDLVRTLRARHEVGAVGVGVAAWLAADRSTVVFAPHLAWRAVAVRETLATRIDLPLVVDNDANAAAWAEYRFGAARGHSAVACITLGTGIGGGLVVDGALVHGGHGLAAEFGHMAIEPDGRQCACGGRGCWEMYASGRALGRDARELAVASPGAAAVLLALAGGDVQTIDGELVTRAAAEGDPAAVTLCTRVGRWLGRGMANLAAVLDPDVFVLGGGVSASGELLLRPAREEFELALSGRGFRPVAAVRLAQLGPQAGLIGAADLAREAAG